MIETWRTFGFKWAKERTATPEFMSEVISLLTVEIEQIGMRKWKSIERVFNKRESAEELVFETATNERQQKDHDD